MTTDERFTCGVCGRAGFRASDGALSRHGYRMVGGMRGTGYAGWQEGGCNGSGRKPLERSPETLLVLYALLVQHERNTVELLRRFEIPTGVNEERLEEFGEATTAVGSAFGLAAGTPVRDCEAGKYAPFASSEARKLRWELVKAIRSLPRIAADIQSVAKSIEGWEEK